MARVTGKQKNLKEASRLDEQIAELVEVTQDRTLIYEKRATMPSFAPRIVDSVTTYGAYEDPI
jgi:hypothetical protein